MLVGSFAAPPCHIACARRRMFSVARGSSVGRFIDARVEKRPFYIRRDVVRRGSGLRRHVRALGSWGDAGGVLCCAPGLVACVLAAHIFRGWGSLRSNRRCVEARRVPSLSHRRLVLAAAIVPTGAAWLLGAGTLPVVSSAAPSELLGVGHAARTFRGSRGLFDAATMPAGATWLWGVGTLPAVLVAPPPELLGVCQAARTFRGLRGLFIAEISRSARPGSWESGLRLLGRLLRP